MPPMDDDQDTDTTRNADSTREADSAHDDAELDANDDDDAFDEDNAEADADGAQQVRDALDADDDDLLEPDIYGDDEDFTPPARPRRKLGLAPTLLLVGGGAWASVMAMRCSPATPPEGGLVVGPADPDEADDGSRDHQAEPARDDLDARGRDPQPADADDDLDSQPVSADAGEPDDEDDAEPEADPPAEDWAKDVTPPDTVTYKVRHGGSIKNVANLFKIYHHEIQALNPGVGLDKELPPGSAVVVYQRQPDSDSQSVGLPSSGTLKGGIPMRDGPGRVLKMIPWKGWATDHTVATLDRVLRQWAADESNGQPILVGNMSSRNGGRLKPHSTHQSGRDVDLGYLQKLPKGEELNWREMTGDNLDPAATWKLFKLLRATGELEVIFVDSKIQKLLYQWARTEGGMSKSTLKRWMEYPRSPPVRNAIIQHVPGHSDHLHARFKCQPNEPSCKSRRR